MRRFNKIRLAILVVVFGCGRRNYINKSVAHVVRSSAVYNQFNSRRHVIVANVQWGVEGPWCGDHHCQDLSAVRVLESGQSLEESVHSSGTHSQGYSDGHKAGLLQDVDAVPSGQERGQ